ncbi:MAG: hydroxyethylthiazole kinase, partial [Microcoleus sp. SIO2G3]|nr:hydroxyethylthiazole kinase [Microcoleus sp. SIO2G3]
MNINPDTIWDDLQTIRQNNPLIHNITNYVVMNNTANALLALGASPIMAHALEEVEDLVKISSALVINIGTLSETWIAAMQKAMLYAQKLNKPIVFDPVGVGATTYRTATTQKLLQLTSPTVIRGNASEVSAILGTEAVSKGVDSTQNSEAAVAAAKSLAQCYQCTVASSGAKDYIIKANQAIKLKNGHPLMAKVTWIGCTSTAIIVAFLAVNSDSLIAATQAMAVMGIAGELAAEK